MRLLIFAGFAVAGLAITAPVSLDEFHVRSPAGHEHLHDPRINWTYYHVEGTEHRDIIRSINQNSPGRYWGRAIWRLSWADEPCSKDDIDIHLEVILPRHREFWRLSPALKASWEMMYDALIMHEVNHIEHGLSALADLVDAECEGGEAIVHYWTMQDILYDRRTNHGLSEGVRLRDPSKIERAWARAEEAEED